MTIRCCGIIHPWNRISMMHCLLICRGTEDADLLADALERRSVLEEAVNTRLHQRFQDWLVIYKRVRHHDYGWLNCPTLQYR